MTKAAGNAALMVRDAPAFFVGAVPGLDPGIRPAPSRQTRIVRLRTASAERGAGLKPAPTSLPICALGDGRGGKGLGKQHAIALALAGAYVCTGW
jgi:hypothetical protein